MKLENIKNLIDEVYDPLNKLEKLESNPKPKMALEITATTQHNPCHDLFRIYTFKLLKKLSEDFEIVVIFRDIVERYGITNITLIKYIIKSPVSQSRTVLLDFITLNF